MLYQEIFPALPGGALCHEADHAVARVRVGHGLARCGDRFEARFRRFTGSDWLRAWVNGYLSDEHCFRPGEGCPFPAVASEIARSGPAARRAFTELFGERMEKVSVHIDAPRAEAERRVLAAFAQMAGALMLARALDEPMATRVREAAAQAALARLDPRDPSVAERFEVFWQGVELANGYRELTAGEEQRLRFAADRERRRVRRRSLPKKLLVRFHPAERTDLEPRGECLEPPPPG